MVRISQQFKDFINLLAAVAIGVASGFWVDAAGKHEPWTRWVVLIGICLAIQIALLFFKSQEMIDLEKYRSDLEEYRDKERYQLRIENAKSEQELKAIKEGRLEDARTWRKELEDSRKERK